MKVDPVVKKETGVIALGVGMLCLLMLAVYSFLKKLVLDVLLGTALGFIAAVINFFLMAFSVQKSAEKMNDAQINDDETPSNEEGEEIEKPLSSEAKLAKKFMQASYTSRMLLMGLVAIMAVTLPFIDAVPCLIAMLFPRIVIFVTQIIRSKREVHG